MKTGLISTENLFVNCTTSSFSLFVIKCLLQRDFLLILNTFPWGRLFDRFGCVSHQAWEGSLLTVGKITNYKYEQL